MGSFFGRQDVGEEEEEDARLRRWRPSLETGQQNAIKKRKASSKSSSSSDSGSASDAASVVSSVSKQSEGSEGDGKSEGSDSDKNSSEDESDDEMAAELARRDLEKLKRKCVVRMEFAPLLALHDPHAEEIDMPAELFAQQKRKRKALRAEQMALQESAIENRRKAKAAADWMHDMGQEECAITDIAPVLGENPDDLRYALVQSYRFTVDDEGIVVRSLLQRIFDVMESDIETMDEVLQKLMDSDARAVKAQIKLSSGELRLKVANDIELVEHVDVQAEQRLQRAEEKERRQQERDERRKAKAKRNKKGQKLDEEESESESSSDEEDGGANREAEKKALAFRRVQVQRKIEEFLRLYTKGQNLTKYNSFGKRYHRRVYVDTARRALVLQGANGPKFYPFGSMKEVDMETRTSKEGRVETMVIIAIEKRGRIVKELTLAFSDSARANTFVNCVTLFSLALAGNNGKK